MVFRAEEQQRCRVDKTITEFPELREATHALAADGNYEGISLRAAPMKWKMTPTPVKMGG
jgi:hypothetical protein